MANTYSSANGAVGGAGTSPSSGAGSPPTTGVNGNMTINGTISGNTLYNSSNYTAAQGYTYSNSTGSISGTFYTDALGMPHGQSMSPDLPTMLIEGYDEHTGKKVKMVLSPESGISNNEIMKLLMLIIGTNTAPTQFNPLAYVKKHNLERHFTYS